MANGRLGKALIEFSLGGNVLDRRGSGATNCGHHADGVQAFDGDHLGLCFEEDSSDLAPNILVAGLGVTAASFMGLRDGAPSAPAVTWLARDVALVLSLFVAASTAALMVGSAAGTDGQVVLGAPVGADDVLCALDVQCFEEHRFWYADLDVEAVAPALEWRAWAVALHWNEVYGANVQPF